MSGTSADAIDAVLIECVGSRFSRVAASYSLPYPASLGQTVRALGDHTAAAKLESLCELDAAIGEAFAAAAIGLLRECNLSATDITAIGSHGQTVFHRGGGSPITLQIGDAARISARTEITTVADFRRADIALGGQGAPLVPAFHHAVFADSSESRAVLNIGGICNLSLLPNTDESHVRGFDVGPGNALLDEWAMLHLGQTFDVGGAFAASGTVNEALVETLLADPFFAAAPPKSTGRGDFNLAWARGLFPGLDHCSSADVQASFAELTARSVVADVQAHQPATRRLIVCGGGTRNDDLMSRLQYRLGAGIEVETSAASGLDPQALEAAAFAWLAMRTIDGLTGNLSAVTGARRAAILGGIYRV